MRYFLSFFGFMLQFGVFAQTFSTAPNAVIPDDNTTIGFDINVSGLPTSIDQNFGLEQICLNINHPYDADLEVSIQAPDGLTIILFSGIGGDQDHFTNTCLDGTSTPISQGTAPFTGNFKSSGFIGNCNNGQDPNGTWRLLLRDMGAQDIGTLLDWSITFSSNPAPPFQFQSSNLPIVILTTVGAAINNDVKVPVLMQIIDNGPGQRNFSNQTDFAFEGTIMTEWQGFTGPYYPKKNYDFQVEDGFGQQMDTSILGMSTEHDWVFKAEYLDQSLMKNTISYEMSRRMGNYAPNTRACELILDGQYIGFYTLTEKVKRDKNRVDIAKLDSTDTTGLNLTGGYIIEMNINGDPADWTSAYAASNSATACCPVEYKHVYPKSDVILPQQHEYIKNYVDQLENVLASPQFSDPDLGYDPLIDVNSFIDFMLVNEFSVNYDSYGRSTYLYKDKGSKLCYGPAWDYDRAIPYDNPGSSSGWVWEITHPYWPFPFHWQRLWEDETYRKKVACRWMMLRQNTLSNGAFTQLVDSLHLQNNEAQERNFQIWTTLNGMTYDTHIDSLKSYLIRRLEWIDLTLSGEDVSLPIVNLPADTTLCNNQSVDAATLNPNFRYEWIGQLPGSAIVFEQSGDFTLKTTDQYGCYSLQTLHVNIQEPDASFTMQADQEDPFHYLFIPHNAQALIYAWDYGNAATGNTQIGEVNYQQSGSYAVKLTVTDSLSCSNEATMNLNFALIDHNPNDAFEGNIYPNPFQDFITIEFMNVLENELRVSIYDVSGKIVLRQKQAKGVQKVSISTKDLACGSYFLHLETGGNTWVNKLIR